jgi:hypothetical protein
LLLTGQHRTEAHADRGHETPRHAFLHTTRPISRTTVASFDHRDFIAPEDRHATCLVDDAQLLVVHI